MSAAAAPLSALRSRERPSTQGAGSTAAAAGAFLALAAFAALAYGELLQHPPAFRLLACAAVATCGCSALAVRRRGGAPLIPLLARPPLLLCTLALALLVIGFPAHLLFAPARWGRLEHRVGGGVDALGGWLWPYLGGDRWARLDVLALVPVVLVVSGALLFWPGARGARRTVSLALLVALFLLGAANTPQQQPGLRGLVLLALIAAWLWAPGAGRETDRAAARAARWLLLPALLALALRPALSSGSAWIGFREAAGAEASTGTFQWDQTYGPISWPRTAATMFTLTAAHPGLLRVTSLDRFDGLRFLRSAAPPDTSALEQRIPVERRFLTRSTVQIAGLRSQQLVSGDGLARRLRWLGGPRPSIAAEGDGTLIASSVSQGSVYSVVAYRPRPTPARLRRAPRSFPSAYMPYVRFQLPAPGATGLAAANLAAEANAPAPVAETVGPAAPGLSPAADPATAARIEASPYAQMFRLARGLAAGAATPYDVAERIDRYLLANYAYDERPPAARYPLEAFLFQQRRGYCQQFSGAMTLMLRMDGIPARVASGFKPDVYDSGNGTWNVRALDAHSWVEVFFTGVGWVAFDPTPAAAIALPGGAGAPVNKTEATSSGSSPAGRARTPLRTATAPRHEAAGGLSLGQIALAVAALLVSGLALLWLAGHQRLRAALRGGEYAVQELSRALALSGESGSRGVTLSALERRMRERGEDRAADYLASLRDRRYSPQRAASASARDRAALRRALMRGLGRGAALRLLASMPPASMRRQASRARARSRAVAPARSR